MRRTLISLTTAAAAALILSACDKPAEKAADNQADNIEAAAQNEATNLQRDAAMTPDVPKANALVREANAVVVQGEESAEAAKDAAKNH